MANESTQLSIRGDAVSIELEGPANDFFGQDLITRAVAHMVEGYDSGWLEKQGEHDAAYRFYAHVLTAVARHHWMSEASEHSDGEDTAQTVLVSLVNWLGEEGYLGEIRRQDTGSL